MRKRLVVSTVVLLLLAGFLTLVWRVCDRPPPGLILKYGLPPAGGPTGRRATLEGVEFVELAPRYFRADVCAPRCRHGDLLGRLSAAFGLRMGRRERHVRGCIQGWQEVTHPVWVSFAVQPWEVHIRINDDAHDRNPRAPGTQHLDSVHIRSATLKESAFLAWHMEDASPAVSAWLTGQFPQVDRLVWIPPEDE